MELALPQLGPVSFALRIELQKLGDKAGSGISHQISVILSNRDSTACLNL